MGANASHFVVNDSWRPNDFIAAAERWYRVNPLHCTATTANELCIATILKNLPTSYVEKVRENHKSYARQHNYTYCSTERAPIDAHEACVKRCARSRAAWWRRRSKNGLLTSPSPHAPARRHV